MGRKARCIMGFAGHMIDYPRRSSPRFPAMAEPNVRAAISDALIRHTPQVAICSAACGGDIIFAEEALNLSIPIFIILPFEDVGKFVELSVAYAGVDWVQRFNQVCSKANEVFYVNPGEYQGPIDFEKNQHAIIFFTLGFGQAVHIQPINLVLYDDTQGVNGPGGTRSYLDLCEGLKLPCEIINMAVIRNHVMLGDNYER